MPWRMYDLEVIARVPGALTLEEDLALACSADSVGAVDDTLGIREPFMPPICVCTMG